MSIKKLGKGLKYITYLFNDMPTIIIFPMTQHHQVVAYKLHLETADILGAGFIKIVKDKFVCHDKSIGLDIEARIPEDTKLANRFLEL